MSQAEHGCSWIPREGSRGFPGEDGEAVLKDFVFLFRPPGLATAADGDRLGPQMPSVPGLPSEVGEHPSKGYLSYPGCSSLHGVRAICYHNTGHPNAPIVECARCLQLSLISIPQSSALDLQLYPQAQTLLLKDQREIPPPSTPTCYTWSLAHCQQSINIE